MALFAPHMAQNEKIKKKVEASLIMFNSFFLLFIFFKEFFINFYLNHFLLFE